MQTFQRYKSVFISPNFRLHGAYPIYFRKKDQITWSKCLNLISLNQRSLPENSPRPVSTNHRPPASPAGAYIWELGHLSQFKGIIKEEVSAGETPADLPFKLSAAK